MSAGIANCEPIPQPQAPSNPQGALLVCSFYGCKQTFSNMQQLSSHIESHQIPTQSLPGEVTQVLLRAAEVSIVKLTMELSHFPSMQLLVEHMRHHYKPNHYFLCESCRAKLRSYRALFKHLHTCAKVAKSKAARAEELAPPVTMATAEGADAMFAADAMAPPPVKNEPMDFDPTPINTAHTPANISHAVSNAEHSISNAGPAPPSTDCTSSSTGPAPSPTETSPSNPSPPLACHPSVSSVPQEPLVPPPALPTLSQGPFPLPEPGASPPGASPSSFHPYPPASDSTSPPSQRLPRPPGPGPSIAAPPTPPGSNAVWKKNQGVLWLGRCDSTHSAHTFRRARGRYAQKEQSSQQAAGQSFSSRILWEHTRGRYSCLQCGYSTPTRQEMTAHIEGQHRSPAGRLQVDMEMRGGSPPFQPKASPDTETAVYTQL
ncbi:hypothetical protein AGOR_G00236570 [Albula goreensis]|uniref:C2H2-type domain-containing protein n=1 Tax=Albula goreensis TaxID=1534307 RepID=A0A8T3CEZ6_9TELE|nr:hypothetical protein AGOR_G00236570 [Albula goreensis]